jgi:hypothetical protein
VLPHHAVDLDTEIGGLAGLAEKRDLVDAEAVLDLAVAALRAHAQRMKRHRHGLRQALQQAVLLVGVEQEADRAEVHAVDPHRALDARVQGFEHEAVAAERHDDVRLIGRHVLVAGLQRGEAALRFGRGGGAKSDGRWHAHGRSRAQTGRHCAVAATGRSRLGRTDQGRAFTNPPLRIRLGTGIAAAAHARQRRRLRERTTA